MIFGFVLPPPPPNQILATPLTTWSCQQTHEAEDSLLLGPNKVHKGDPYDLPEI